MGHVLRFRFNRQTGEVEFFTVDTDGEFRAEQVHDAEHNRAHDEFTRRVADRLASNMSIDELVDFVPPPPIPTPVPRGRVDDTQVHDQTTRQRQARR